MRIDTTREHLDRSQYVTCACVRVRNARLSLMKNAVQHTTDGMLIVLTVGKFDSNVVCHISQSPIDKISNSQHQTIEEHRKGTYANCRDV